jgi:NitT/TauT family transport system permease protein
MAETVELDRQLGGLDALEIAPPPRPPRLLRWWGALWPKLAAVAIVVAVWQLVVWSGWRPDYLLPGPLTVGRALGELVRDAEFWHAVSITMGRALVGFALALVIGTAVGLAVGRSRLLRSAVGAMVTGLQTMPSIVWFPLAILLFQLSESAILFVVVLGAAPSVANGLLAGIDHIPPLYLRAGHVLGARGAELYRSVILPAAMPSFVSGLKQGWAFAWRSLVAGELLVIVANRPSLGAQLQFAREFSDAPGLLALTVVFLVIGLIVDGVFGWIDAGLRRRRGLASG